MTVLGTVPGGALMSADRSSSTNGTTGGGGGGGSASYLIYGSVGTAGTTVTTASTTYTVGIGGYVPPPMTPSTPMAVEDAVAARFMHQLMNKTSEVELPTENKHKNNDITWGSDED